MFTVNVYTLGDVGSYWSMLNGVAMIFGLKGFWASAGLTGALMLLVMVCLYMLAKSGGGSGGHSPFLGPIYFGGLFFALSINTSVVVQDIYTGKIIKVDNIPLIISLPSSLMTTAAYRVATTIDTAFSTVDGNYVALGTYGMDSPLKLLMSMRKGFSTTSPNLALSIKIFSQTCTTGNGSNFDKGKYEASPNGFAYLTAPGNYNPTALTFDFPAAGSTPVALNCDQEARNLIARVHQYMTMNSADGNPNMVIAANMGSVVKPDGTPNSFNDAQQTIQSVVINHLHSANQQSLDVMQNMLFYDVINSGLDCAGVGMSAQESNACWSENAVIRQGLEKWKSDAAAAGTFFTKLMAQSIVFLQLMFFGFSPIIALVCLFMGEKSLGLFAKYLIFGVWTISWLPFASVIQMYVQNQIASRIGAITTVSIGGITPGNLSDYYDMVSGNIGLASDLLGMVPMVSLGLLTGSAMALSGMAKHFDAMSTHGDASNSTSPGLNKNGTVFSEDSRAVGNTAGTNLSGTEKFAPTFQNRIDGSTTMQSTAQSVMASSSELSKSASNLYNAMHSRGAGLTRNMEATTSLGSALTRQSQSQSAFQTKLDNATNLSAQTKAALSAGVSGGIPLGDMISFLKVNAGASGEMAGGKGEAMQFLEANSASYSSAASATKNLQAAASNAISASSTIKDDTVNATSHAASNALKSSQTASNSFGKTMSTMQGANIAYAVDGKTFAAGVLGDPARSAMATNMLNQIENAGGADARRIADRSHFFQNQGGMQQQNANVLALGEMLAERKMRSDANAGASFDALNTVAAPAQIGSVSDNTGVNASGLVSSAGKLQQIPLPAGNVVGSSGYSIQKESHYDNQVHQDGVPLISPEQAKGVWGGDFEKNATNTMRDTGNPGAVDTTVSETVKSQTNEVPKTIAQGQRVIKEGSATEQLTARKFGTPETRENKQFTKSLKDANQNFTPM